MKGSWLAFAIISLAFVGAAGAGPEPAAIPAAEVPSWVLAAPRERPPANPGDGKDHAEGTWSTVIFAEETVHVARMPCAACGTAHVRYFSIG